MWFQNRRAKWRKSERFQIPTTGGGGTDEIDEKGMDDDAGSDVSCGGIDASIDVVSDGDGHHCQTGNCSDVGVDSYDDVIVDDVTVTGANSTDKSPTQEGQLSTKRHRHYDVDSEVGEQDANHVQSSTHFRPCETPPNAVRQSGCCSPAQSVATTDFRASIVERFPVYGSMSVAGQYFQTTCSSNTGCDVTNERHQTTTSSFARNYFPAPCTVPSNHGSRDTNRGLLLAEVCDTMSRMRRSLHEEQSAGQLDSIL